MLARYRPSGRIGARLPVVTVLMIGAGIAAGAGYSWLTHKNAIPKWDVLFTLALAAGVFGIVWSGVHLAKCRSTVASVIVAALVGSTAIGVSHYRAYLRAARTQAPGVSLSFADYLNSTVRMGWNISRRGRSPQMVTGWMVWAIWSAEAFLVLGAAGAGAWHSSRRPFCEPCRRWCEHPFCVFAVPGLSSETVASMKRAGSLDTLLLPPLAEIAPSDRSVEYKVVTCPDCMSIGVLRLTLTVTTRHRKKTSTTESAIVSGVILDRPEMDAIRQLQADVDGVLLLADGEEAIQPA